VKHYPVTTNDEGKYVFGLATFANVTEFVEHFQRQPLLGGESGIFDSFTFPASHVTGNVSFR